MKPAYLALCLAACAHSPPSDQANPDPAGSPPLAAAPVDHLAPGELAEGTEHVWGLALPQALHVDRSFSGSIHASGALSIHPLVRYFRSRLHGGVVEEDDSSATLRHFKIPAFPDREMTIRIGLGKPGVQVELDDTTPPPAPNLPDQAARWRNVGLTPDGRQITDPALLTR